MSDSIQASRAIVERPLVEIIGEQEELRIWGCYEIFYVLSGFTDFGVELFLS